MANIPGLLTEDTQTLEVVRPDGQQELRRVADRQQASQALKESAAPDKAKPLHD